MNKINLYFKNIFLKTLIFGFLVFLYSSTYAQKGTVLVMNADTKFAKQTIFIKWFIKEVICNNGVNIYRKKLGENKWTKINNKPYKFGTPILKKHYEQDLTLNEFVKLINETTEKDLKGIILLNILLKGIQSDIYSKYLGILYEDNSVVLGETYSYKVMKINGNNEELIGISPNIKVGDYIAEIAPQKIEITAGKHRANIVWKPELERYYAVSIYRSSSINSKEQLLNELPIMLSYKIEKDGSKSLPEPYFINDSLQNDVTYYYRIVGENFFGRKTETSDTVAVIIKDLIPPLPPYNLHPMQDNLKTTLIWDITESEDLFGFNVFRSKTDSIYSKINSTILLPTDTMFVDSVDRSGNYFYYVIATDKEGNEARSTKLMVTIPDIIPPIKIEGLEAKADTGKIHLKWIKNKDEDLLGYIIYRRIAGKKEKEFAPLIADPVKEAKFTDKLPKIAKNYFEYSVAAIDSSYNISELSNIVSAQMPDILAPHKPHFKKTSITEEGIIIEWIPNMEPDLMGYNIFRKEKSEAKEYIKLNKDLLSPATYQFTDKETKNGLVYYYILTAIDSTKNISSPSVPFLGAIKEPEQTDSSSIKKVSITYNSKKKAIRIKWKVSEEDEYKGCVIYRKEAEKPFKSITGLIKKHEFFDENIKVGETYFYQIRIYENNGKVYKSEIIEIKIIK